MDTINMTLTLTYEKEERLKDVSLSSCVVAIRTIASFLGNLVSSSGAIPNGNVCYLDIEQ